MNEGTRYTVETVGTGIAVLGMAIATGVLFGRDATNRLIEASKTGQLDVPSHGQSIVVDDDLNGEVDAVLSLEKKAVLVAEDMRGNKDFTEKYGITPGTPTMTGDQRYELSDEFNLQKCRFESVRKSRRKRLDNKSARIRQQATTQPAYNQRTGF